MIYASTRRAVDQLTMLLERAKIPAMGYHAGLDDAREVDGGLRSEDQVAAVDVDVLVGRVERGRLAPHGPVRRREDVAHVEAQLDQRISSIIRIIPTACSITNYSRPN